MLWERVNNDFYIMEVEWKAFVFLWILFISLMIFLDHFIKD